MQDRIALAGPGRAGRELWGNCEIRKGVTHETLNFICRDTLRPCFGTTSFGRHTLPSKP